MKKATLALCLLLIINVLQSCKSRRIGPRNSNLTAVEQFWANQQDFEYLSLRGKATINTNGSDQTATVSIRMKRDSIVWITGGLFGFEGVRAIVTVDSFKMIDKINRNYYAYGIDAVESYLGFKMTVTQLQDLLIANALFDKESYRSYDSSNMIKTEKGNLSNTINIDDNGRVSLAKYTSSVMSQLTDIEYTEYEKFDGIILPKNVNTKVSQAGNKSTVVINYQSANVSIISNFPFSIPDGYTKK